MELSDEIKLCRDGAADNPYQGNDKKVLFVCSMGILRSATAARLYARQFNTRSCGTYAEALIPLSYMLIKWAEEIVFVSPANYKQAAARYGTEFLRDEAKIKVLQIPDNYPHMDPKLIEAFSEQYAPLGEVVG